MRLHGACPGQYCQGNCASDHTFQCLPWTMSPPHHHVESQSTFASVSYKVSRDFHCPRPWVLFSSGPLPKRQWLLVCAKAEGRDPASLMLELGLEWNVSCISYVGAISSDRHEHTCLIVFPTAILLLFFSMFLCPHKTMGNCRTEIRCLTSVIILGTMFTLKKSQFCSANKVYMNRRKCGTLSAVSELWLRPGVMDERC